MISILCPTRNRPANVERLIQSIYNTAPAPAFEILFYVDDDDNPYEVQIEHDDRVQFVRGPRLVHSDYWNTLAAVATGDLLMMMGDDVVFKTVGWSGMVEDAFLAVPDHVLLVFGDDLGPARGRFATLPIVHRTWYETVGRFAGPGFSADYADTWPNDIADMIGRKKFLPFVVEHLHWTFGKSKKDQTYAETQARLSRDNTPALYAKRLPDRLADAEKLRKVIREYERAQREVSDLAAGTDSQTT
jgi:glycosyltransferase involved in cell wall biosynthesis